MLSTLLRIVVPANSRRGKLFRVYLTKLRKQRARNFSRSRYNESRHSYYAHALKTKSNDESSKVSIIVPCLNTPARYFEPLLASIFAQSYSNWELILVDASDNNKSSKYLYGKAEADIRIRYIKIENKGIAENTNKGIAEANGDYIAFLDHDDLLDPSALADSVDFFIKNPATSLVYSDEDKVSEDGEEYFEPHYKPDFSLDMLRNVNYITHFVVARKTTVDELGGIRVEFDGAQDYDFLLRAVDLHISIGHVPKILYHWRQAEGSTAADFSNKKHILKAGCKALDDHYRRNGIKSVKAYAIKNRPGFYSVKFDAKRDNLRIILNFSSLRLSTVEKQFIIETYKNNEDVRKHKIKVTEGKPKETTNNDLVVNGAYIPAHKKTDIISMFMVASEDTVNAVAPKIIRNGRILDMGIVNVCGQPKRLFKGVDPSKSISFGLLEWVRNVDELTGKVVVGDNEPGKQGRFVVWSHSEFVAFEGLYSPDLKSRHSFYNRNLVELTEIIEGSNDYITDLIVEKK